MALHLEKVLKWKVSLLTDKFATFHRIEVVNPS